MGIDVTYITQTRAAILATVRRMLDGDCSYIEGTRLICGLLDDARLNSQQQPFVVFVGIQSETDDVPVGEVRERWHPEARIKLEQNWADAERYAKTCGEPACHKAIEWFAEKPFVIR